MLHSHLQHNDEVAVVYRGKVCIRRVLRVLRSGSVILTDDRKYRPDGKACEGSGRWFHPTEELRAMAQAQVQSRALAREHRRHCYDQSA